MRAKPPRIRTMEVDMKVKELMTSEVHGLDEDASLIDALKLMIDRRISGLPVVDSGGRLVGILTEGDLLRRAETGSEIHRPVWLQYLTSDRRLADEYVKAHARRVTELMTPNPVSISQDATAEDAVDLMLKHKIKRLPVVENGRLVGLVARSDLIKGLYSRIGGEHRPNLNDEQIADAISKLVERQKWAPKGTLQVRVIDGVVELEGIVFNEAARKALRVMVENIPGVADVVDEISWMDPLSGITVPPPGVERSPPIDLRSRGKNRSGDEDTSEKS